MSEEQTTLTEAEEEELYDYLGGDYPKVKEKENMFAFFSKILGSKESSKVSNLDADELQYVRTLLSTAGYAKTMKLKGVFEYLMQEAEDILKTALSKSGFLITTAVTQKKQFESKSGGGKQSKWNLGTKT